MWRKGRRIWNEKMKEHLEIRIIEEPQEKSVEKAGKQMFDGKSVEKQVPEISYQEFKDHIEDDDLFLTYGNPVIVNTEDGKKFVCMAWSMYERYLRLTGQNEKADGLLGASSEMNDMTKRLNNIEDSYYDFVCAVLMYVKDNPARYEKVERFLDDNPKALTSDIISFISDQDDFYQDGCGLW